MSPELKAFAGQLVTAELALQKMSGIWLPERSIVARHRDDAMN
jgi:hypothetical protein